MGIRVLYHKEHETLTISKDIYQDLCFPSSEKKPYVVINMVSSVDGKATINGELKKTPIGSRFDREMMGWIRQAVDVVIRGAGTVRANPAYPFLNEEQKSVRKRNGLNEHVLAAVISGSCNLPLHGSLFTKAPQRPIIFTTDQVDTELINTYTSYADVVKVAGPMVQPDKVLGILRDKYQVKKVLLEGGPTLNYQFIKDNLVDEIFLTVAPCLIGGKNELSIVNGDITFDPMPKLEMISAFLSANELFLRYKVRSARQM